MVQGAADRAFVDGVLRLQWGRGEQPRGRLRALHHQLRLAAEAAHARLRAGLRAGSVGPQALRQLFDAVPSAERDHFVEEVLGIAYPPLVEEEFHSAEHMTYTPSGYEEITHAFDATGLSATGRFIDLGSGLGKVTMLAALLTGATSVGVEIDAVLCAGARTAAAAIGLQRVTFQHADAREVDADADVVFMYLPFAGGALETVLTRLACAEGALAHRRAAREAQAPARVRYLCSGALELARHPELRLAAPPRSWLNVYAWG